MRRSRLSLFLICSLACLHAQANSEQTWVDYAIEGTLSRLDPELAPALREGMVLSAVYALNLEAEAIDLEPARSRARYYSVVDQVELAIDLNYIQAYKASTGLGDRWVELTQAGGDSEADDDLYSILLPLKGDALGEEGWTARWLQLWFYGDKQGMLKTTDLQAPPATFRTGWWRITFWNTAGDRSVLAEGTIELSGTAGEPLTPSEQIAQLEAVVLRLGDQIQAQTIQNASLQAELASAQARIDGLQKTVDVIFEERRILQDKYELLKLEKATDSPALRDQLASLEAQLAFKVEQELLWQAKTQASDEALAKAESEYAELLNTVSTLEIQLREALSEKEATVVAEEPIRPEPPLAKETFTPAPAPAIKTPETERRLWHRRPGKFSR